MSELPAKIYSIQQIANLHIQRIQQALAEVEHLFPLDKNIVINFDKEQLFAIEMFTSRFAKLQDFLGNVVFDVFFEIEGENTATWSLIDKINKLEKYGIIEDTIVWRTMREIRNALAHEYPEQPNIIADHLNETYEHVPALLTITEKIFTKMIADSK